MATHASVLACRIPRTGEPGGLLSMGSLESDPTERLPFHFSLSCIGEGNGNPLQCSCLQNPKDGEAWWAVIYGVTQSQTRLKRLSSSSTRKSFRDQFLNSPNLHCCLVAQSCPTLCDPIDGSPPDSPVPGILQARTLE